LLNTAAADALRQEAGVERKGQSARAPTAAHARAYKAGMARR